MANTKPPIAADVVGCGVYAGVPLGALIGWFLAWSQVPKLPLLPTVLKSVIITVAIIGGAVFLEQSRKRQKWNKERASEEQARVRAELKAAERESDNAVLAARAVPPQVVESYRMAVSRLEEASVWLDTARDHHVNGAFTPFWESIERGYAQLGEFNEQVGRIQRLADQFPGLLQRVADLAPDRLSTVPPFPVEAKQICSVNAAQRLASSLQSQTYAAQKDYHFAQIFETRRTTAAVISGFQSLSGAVAGMVAAIEQQTMQLSGSIDSVGRETERVVRSLDVPVFSTDSLSLGGQMVMLNRQIEQIASRLR